jgi:hypothetical protein
MPINDRRAADLHPGDVLLNYGRRWHVVAVDPSPGDWIKLQLRPEVPIGHESIAYHRCDADTMWPVVVAPDDDDRPAGKNPDDEFLALQARINGGYEAIWKARKAHGVEPGESLMEHLRTCDCDTERDGLRHEGRG